METLPMTQANPEILAASLTPLDNNQSIDKQRFADHVQHLLDNGCNGVLLFGTTGEANSFTVFERQAALESLLKSGIPPATLMVGTGCCALPDTLALTRHALEHGVHRAVVLPPFYYKTATDDGLYDTFAALIDQVGDPALRVYLYHFPKMAVVGFSSELIARLVAKFPEQIAGIKDSTGNREHTEMLNARFPSLKVYAGSEMFLLDYLRAGGIGCISATMNLTARLAATVCDHSNHADAEQYQAQLSAVRALFERYPVIGALKGLLASHTGHAGWQNVRVPLSRLPVDQVVELRHELSELNFPIQYG
ncbi:MAG: dihydrodipicolinate synthase family protein [Gammaproteobacteria bacterium]|nr:dihydrodipicolinate synthase family protein [Gammaproteobacteria bacterium]